MPKNLHEIMRAEPVIYLTDEAAKEQGLGPRDIVQPEYQGKYIMLESKEKILDLRAIQDEMKQKKQRGLNPVLSAAPASKLPTVILADDEMSAEELQDVAGMAYEKNEAAARKYGESVNTDWVRMLNGLPVGQRRADMISQAYADRIKKHKENPITDPFRDPWQTSRDQGLIPMQVSVPDTYDIK